jgi:hypothetical protein
MKTTIIIPYRKRERHLEYYMNNTWPIIHSVMPYAHLLIVEQDEGKPFNRGLMINIGVLDSSDSEYIMTQDVDTNPRQHIVEGLYTKEVDDNAVLGIFTSICNTLGGIIKMKRSAFLHVNGFPSNFFGWGVEDKAFQNRCEYYNYTITKNKYPTDSDIQDHFTVFDDVNDKEAIDNHIKTSIYYGQYPHFNRETQLKLMMSSGINTASYSVIERTSIADRVDHIKVHI